MRAIDYLREQGADVDYVAATRTWRLRDPDFALPVDDPDERDLVSMLTAAGLLEQLGADAVARRVHQMFRDLAAKVTGGKPRIRTGTLIVRQTTSTPVNWSWILELLRACQREVVRVEYRSSWSKQGPCSHDFEPWELRLHEGVFYVRGYSRWEKCEWTLRVAAIEKLQRVEGDKPRAAFVPFSAEHETGFGIDLNHPDNATVRLGGSIARWQRFVRWAAVQHDDWDEQAGTLTLKVHYRSCREFARRLASIADGIESVQPTALRLELRRILADGFTRIESMAGD